MSDRTTFQLAVKDHAFAAAEAVIKNAREKYGDDFMITMQFAKSELHPDGAKMIVDVARLSPGDDLP